MRLEIGSRLGPYEVTGWVGAGGMGEVYRARDIRLGREVAIKVLPAAMAQDADRLTRFRREASSASALNHRNIVTVHDFSADGGDVWLVMELITGESLRAALARGPYPLKKTLAIASGIADGLAAAHAAGIVHRDIKPENVMVSADGTPKILDFGLVKQAAVVSDADSPTLAMVSDAGVVMGTAAYMSPEQARGEPLDFRSDQFSLGVMLQEMSSGKHPFIKQSGIATLAAILNEDPAPHADHVPPRLRDIIDRCLSKSPEDRYGSTGDLAHDLRRAGSGPEPKATFEERTRNGAVRMWPVVLGALLIGAVAATVATKTLSRDSRSALPQTYQASIATPQLKQVFRDEIAQSVTISPDGRYLVVYGSDQDNVSALWLHDLNTGARRLLAENAFSVGWAPDSKAIAFFADEKLKTVSVDGGPPRIVCDARPESIPSWHGETILFGQFSVKEPGIYSVSSSGGNPVRIVGPQPRRVGNVPLWPEFLPGGKHLLYLLLLQSSTNDGTIAHELYVAPLDGKPAKRVVAPIDSRVVYRDGTLFFVRDGTLLAQTFDPASATFSGEAKALVTGVHYFRSTGMSAFSVSDTGALAWRDAIPASRLVWMDRSGVELKEVATAAFSPDGRLSADGKRYAVGVVDPKQGVADVWVYDLARESSERITFRPLDEKWPVWSPDGRSMYYRSDGGGGPPDIFLWNPGSQAGVNVHSGPGVEEPHDIAPDGSVMLFLERRQLASEDIYLLPLTAGGVARPWRATSFNESSPRFSPDGKWVAYHSNFSGRPEVYVSALAPDAAPQRISRNGGTLPRWARTGKELFFLAPGGRVMSAVVENGSSVGLPKNLFQSPEAVTFEPAPDGARFLVQLEQRTNEPTVQILTNWRTRIEAAADPAR
jgi:eukaryotic-like serine/threonine-protein kinase